MMHEENDGWTFMPRGPEATDRKITLEELRKYGRYDEGLKLLTGSVATLHSPHGRLAGCSSWRLRFVVYPEWRQFKPEVILMAENLYGLVS